MRRGRKRLRCARGAGRRRLVFGASLARRRAGRARQPLRQVRAAASPRPALPRHANAPISVRVDGTVRTLSGRPAAGAALHLDRDQPRRPDRNQGPAGLPALADRAGDLGGRRWRPAGTALVGDRALRRRRRLPRTEHLPAAGPDPRLQHGDRRASGRSSPTSTAASRSRTAASSSSTSARPSGTFGTVLTAALPVDSTATAT